MPGKLGRTSEQRLAILRNQASSLLWYGKIETTKARAKELRSYVEKIITAAVLAFALSEKDAIVRAICGERTGTAANRS